MSAFTASMFSWNAGSFVARHPAGSVDSVELTFPDNFPGHPGLSETLEVEIESIAVSLTTSGISANRRVRLQVLTPGADDQVLWLSAAQQATAVSSRRFHFTSPGLEVQIAGLLNKEVLPRMVMGQSSQLVVDIQNVQAGDVLEEVIVQGRYRIA